MIINYKAAMNITVDGQKLPDPSEWNYTVSDLDTEGGRDATGYLHRAYVATKINYEFSWNGLEWEMLQVILGAVNKPKFELQAPDPRTFREMYKGEYYVGDRTGKAHYFAGDATYNQKPGRYVLHTGNPEVAVYTLKLKFIEY